MQLDLQFSADQKPAPAGEMLIAGARAVPVTFIRSLKARRYILRLRQDGTARVTVPRGGSFSEARRFAQRQTAWLERQVVRLAARPVHPADWRVGGSIFFRGGQVLLEADASGRAVRFAGEAVRVADTTGDLRPTIEKHLRKLAARELPPRVIELAALHAVAVGRVSVRNQHSRWGSCSRSGTISLNWRLIQTPDSVRDYIILHELMHVRQMNHSARFWREVAAVCPGYEEAERWIKLHSVLLR